MIIIQFKKMKKLVLFRKFFVYSASFSFIFLKKFINLKFITWIFEMISVEIRGRKFN